MSRWASYACLEKAGLREDPRSLSQPESVNARLSRLLNEHITRIIEKTRSLRLLFFFLWRGMRASGAIPPMANARTVDETERFVRTTVRQRKKATVTDDAPQPIQNAMAPTAPTSTPAVDTVIETTLGAFPRECFDAAVAAQMLAVRGAMKTTRQRELEVALAVEATKQRQIEADVEKQRIQSATDERRFALELRRLELTSKTQAAAADDDVDSPASVGDAHPTERSHRHPSVSPENEQLELE